MLRWSTDGESVTRTAGVDVALQESERKLAESPIVSMFLDSLVPAANLVVGEKFELDSKITSRLLSLDAIQSGSLTVAIVDRKKTNNN